MATKILMNGPKLSSYNDFFVAYDSHEQRAFESWELQIIFMDAITKPEADSLVMSMGVRTMGCNDNAIMCSELLRQLQ